MGMSEHERRLLVTGTLDTSGIGGSPYERLENVTVAFAAAEDLVPAAAVEPVVAETEPVAKKVAEKEPSEPVKEPEQAPDPEPVKAEEKPAPRKRAAKKTQASAPAEK